MGVSGERQGILHSIRSRLGFSSIIDRRYDTQSRPRDPITLTVSTRESKPFQQYTEVRRDLAWRQELYNLRQRNGVAANIIDAYEHGIWTNGWKVEASEGMEDLAERVTERLQKIHAESALRTMTNDGLAFEYGVAEKAYSQDIFTDPRLLLVPRSSHKFILITNRQGTLVAARQFGDDGKVRAELPVEKAVILCPLGASEGFGRSLLAQAYEPLIWWDKVNRSSADSIYRHGYPVWDVQVAGPDGKLAPLDVMTGAEQVTVDLNPNSELITNAMSKIAELNSGGVPLVDKYGEWALQQICAVTAIPAEYFGLGGGETGLLAEFKLRIFYDRITSIQHNLEPQIDDQLIDPIALEEGGAPGDCHFVFNNPNPENDLKKAQFCQMLLQINPLDPVVDTPWIRDYMGIKQPELQQGDPFLDLFKQDGQGEADPFLDMFKRQGGGQVAKSG